MSLICYCNECNMDIDSNKGELVCRSCYDSNIEEKDAEIKELEDSIDEKDSIIYDLTSKNT